MITINLQKEDGIPNRVRAVIRQITHDLNQDIVLVVFDKQYLKDNGEPLTSKDHQSINSTPKRENYSQEDDGTSYHTAVEIRKQKVIEARFNETKFVALVKEILNESGYPIE